MGDPDFLSYLRSDYLCSTDISKEHPGELTLERSDEPTLIAPPRDLRLGQYWTCLWTEPVAN